MRGGRRSNGDGRARYDRRLRRERDSSCRRNASRPADSRLLAPPTMTHAPTTTPIACTPATVPPELRARWVELGRWVYGAIGELRGLPDGYACRLPSDAQSLLRAAEYVSLDRHCCKFVTWQLRIEPDEGAVWLWITGPEGTKDFCRSIFETTNLVEESVLRAAGLRVLGRHDAALGAPTS